MLRAQAGLRIGETDNCCSENTADSCLLPLSGKAIYRHQDGPRKAIEIFWPATARTQHIPSVPMEHFYKVREGDSIAVPWKVSTFKFLSPS